MKFAAAFLALAWSLKAAAPGVTRWMETQPGSVA